ncbi:MAG TPA: hypothetical protein VD793_05880, partial [Gemmatimonadales bacterium]|nr:hypothetical protein [Gemmatimonadales bacterium]
LPMFAEFLKAAGDLRDHRDFEPPPELHVARVDPETGLGAGWGCAGETEYFLPGTEPEPGPGCWGLERLPGWIADAGGKVTAGVRSLLGGLFGGRSRGR